MSNHGGRHADHPEPEIDSEENNINVSGEDDDNHYQNRQDDDYDDDDDENAADYSEEIEVSERGNVDIMYPSESGGSSSLHGRLPEDDNGGDDMEDLDSMLESMDIDKDFQMFNSFRNSMSRRSSNPSYNSRDSADDDNKLSAVSEEEDTMESQDLGKWEQRLQREEVFSHRYHPSKQEQKELTELEKSLHMNRLLSNLGKAPSEDQEVWKQLVHPDPKKTTPSSIILKRGPVCYKTSAEAEPKEHEIEVIVLTHGFVIASVVENGRTVKRNFERALEYTTVVRVAPDSSDETAWEMVVRSPRCGQERLTFISGSPKQQAAWLKAMEIVLVSHCMHNKAYPKDIGWQYKIIHKPAFTMAVLGVEDDLEIPSKRYLNQLDQYKGYSPLHYAVRLKHVEIVQSLLEENADPNLPDEDGLSCVYHAVHDEAPQAILDLLQNYGADNMNKIVSERDELFDRVTATNSEREVRREKEQQKQAQAAQAKMSENMRLLQERGQKIDDASDKARQMNENAREYGDLAAQLKAKTKKQAGWNPFG